MSKLTTRIFRTLQEADVYVDRQIARKKRVSILSGDIFTVYSK